MNAAPAVVPTYPLETVMKMITPGARARKTKSLLVYLHVPFCSSKCHFCDWVVGYDTNDLVNTGDLRDRYVDAMCAQIRSMGPHLQALGYTATHIYWGGGTPTRIAPEHLTRIHTALSEVIDLSNITEHTAECSPETVTRAHLEALMQGGLNRVSVGIQSFADPILRRMGRAHDSGQGERAITLFKEVGLRNFNIDLIAGFPDQTSEQLFSSIQKTVDLGVPHVSLYMFRETVPDLVSLRQVKTGHRLQSARVDRSEAYFAAKAMLEAAGYEEYIVGYFARDKAFRFDGEDYYFNLRGDYVGFGAGAASTLGRHTLKSGRPGRYGGPDVRGYVDDPTKMLAAPIAMLPDDMVTGLLFKAFATPEAIRFDRWRDHCGYEFRAMRDRRPGIRRWFEEQEAAGARFVETSEGIALSDETRIPTMIWRK